MTTIVDKRTKFRRTNQKKAEGYKYVNGCKDAQGKIVIRALDEEEREWLTQFEDGTLANNHRKYDIFTSHPEYRTRIKKELDAATNAGNSDLYTRLENGLLLASDDKEISVEKSIFERISEGFKFAGYEKVARTLLQETLGYLNIPYNQHSVSNLLRFHSYMSRLGKLERRDKLTRNK